MSEEMEIEGGLEADETPDDADLGDGGKTKSSPWTDPDPEP